MRELVQDNRSKQSESAQNAHDDIGVKVLVRHDCRKIAGKADDEIERQKEPRDVDADAEAQQIRDENGPETCGSSKGALRGQPRRPAPRICNGTERSSSEPVSAAQTSTSCNTLMIAFAPGDLAAEGPVDKGCIGENERQKQEGPDQAENLGLGNGCRLPDGDARRHEIGEGRDRKPRKTEEKKHHCRKKGLDARSGSRPR